MTMDEESPTAGTPVSTFEKRLSSTHHHHHQNQNNKQNPNVRKGGPPDEHIPEEREEEEVEDFGGSLSSSVAPTPPPPPPLPTSSLRDHRCPIHSVLVRNESGQSGGSNSLTATSSGQESSHHHHHHKHVLPTTPFRKYDLKSSTIRQHYYPEGGWGWLVCACAFMVHVLTTGMQLSYGVLYSELLTHYGSQYVIEGGWLGALSTSVSLFLAPFVVALCRRKSTRLTAVFGGLVMALACLFTSFAQQLHQAFVSYGFVMGAGVALTRETSNLMIGQYFKRKREFIEIFVQAGSGIGISLFSVFFNETISAIGWRLGLQAVTGVLFSGFILGIFYRSASLYHPQRRAILHLKNQKRKVKDKKGMGSSGGQDDKPPYFDFTTIKTRTLQIIMLSAGTAALGIYSPIFYLAVHCKQEGLDSSSIILIQTFIGFAFAIGNMGFGMVVVRQNDQCHIARQYLCQASLFGLGLAILALSTIRGYHSYVLFAWMYGIFLGGYHFSLKLYTFEKMRARHFARAWAFVQWAKSLPLLFGVPITGYINNMHQGQTSKSGFYFACAFTFVGASCLFLMNVHRQRFQKNGQMVRFSTVESRMSPTIYAAGRSASPYEDGVVTTCGCEMGSPRTTPEVAMTTTHGGGGGGVGCSGGVVETCHHHHHHHHHPSLARLQGKSISFASSVDGIDSKREGDDYLTCISEEGLQEYYVGADCITSCNKVENFLLFSEFENNLQSDGTLPKNDLQRAVCKHGHHLVVYSPTPCSSEPTPVVIDVVSPKTPRPTYETEEDFDDDDDDNDDLDKLNEEEAESSDLVPPLVPAESPVPRVTKSNSTLRPRGRGGRGRRQPTRKNITVVEEMTTSV